jgi:hypothetical protein
MMRQNIRGSRSTYYASDDHRKELDVTVGIPFQRVCGQRVGFISTDRTIRKNVETWREDDRKEECATAADYIEK